MSVLHSSSVRTRRAVSLHCGLPPVRLIRSSSCALTSRDVINVSGRRCSTDCRGMWTSSTACGCQSPRLLGSPIAPPQSDGEAKPTGADRLDHVLAGRNQGPTTRNIPMFPGCVPLYSPVGREMPRDAPEKRLLYDPNDRQPFHPTGRSIEQARFNRHLRSVPFHCATFASDRGLSLHSTPSLPG